jgi:hypothetical protein
MCEEQVGLSNWTKESPFQLQTHKKSNNKRLEVKLEQEIHMTEKCLQKHAYDTKLFKTTRWKDRVFHSNDGQLACKKFSWLNNELKQNKMIFTKKKKLDLIVKDFKETEKEVKVWLKW